MSAHGKHRIGDLEKHLGKDGCRVSTAQEFARETGIGLPEVVQMLGANRSNVYRTRTVKKIENAFGRGCKDRLVKPLRP